MDELISQAYFDFTHPILSDGIVKTFIHKSCAMKPWIQSMLSDVGNLIDVDFKVVKRQKRAELKFFETDLIYGNPEYLGLAVPLISLKGNYWDLYVRSDAGQYKRWAYLHELGHFLGMEHPHDDLDGDLWEFQTTNDTVMSYNYTASYDWRFRQADVDTITGMWISK